VRIAAVEALAADPEAVPLLRALLRDPDAAVCATAVGALAVDPADLTFLYEALRDPNPAVRSAAVHRLATHPGGLAMLPLALRDDHWSVRVAAARALSGEPWARSAITALLGDGDDDVRAAAVEALGPAPEASQALRGALADTSPVVRAAAARALAPDPAVRSLLRDLVPAVRAAAAAALRRARPSRSGVPVGALGPVAQACAAMGWGMGPGVQMEAPSPLLAEQLLAFVQAPCTIDVDRDPDFAELVLGWICARLTRTEGPEDGGQVRLFGELRAAPPLLLHASDEQLVIRIAMSAEDLPAERMLYPLHNLIEAWRIARRLRTARPLVLWLACADVDFEDLAPPDPPSPGDLHCGPTFFGLRLGASDEETATLPDWLALASEADQFRRMSSEARAPFIQALARLVRAPDLAPWALAPLAARIGQDLPPALRAALAARMPSSAVEAESLLAAARSALEDSTDRASNGPKGRSDV
jgi:hypothetical protein